MSGDRQSDNNDLGSAAAQVSPEQLLADKARSVAMKNAFASDSLPAAVTARLDESRRLAVEAANARRRSGLATAAERWFRLPTAAWGGGLAVSAAALLGVALMLRVAPFDGSEVGTPPAAALATIESIDDLDLIEELEFYAWLDELEALDRG